MTAVTASTARRWPNRLTLVVSVIGLLVVAWAVATGWDGIVHSHPLYPVLLGVTAVGCVLLGWLNLRRGPRRAGVLRLVGRILLVVMGIGWIAAIAWLRPAAAVEPALAAMVSDSRVTVTESATEIVFTPQQNKASTGVFFQPGALVDARAYAAVLRPLAEAGQTVVIPKQPVGIAFLALGAFDAARAEFSDVDGWILGGHSLGGTVAAIQASAGQSEKSGPAIGLLFFASYPATDLSSTLTIPVESISGTRDGLSTPAKIEASRANLPADAVFTVVTGASHAQFGAYGPQAGDNTPQISNDDAREQIIAASLRFVGEISGKAAADK